MLPHSSPRSQAAGLLLTYFVALCVAPGAIAVPTPDPCFSPDQSCDERLWKWLRKAEKTLDVAVFDLTHEKITHELLVASRKVKLRVVVDRRQSKGQHSLVSTLVKAGVDVRIGRQRGIMHNKFAVADGVRLVTGSFNWTNGAANKNAENQLYVDDAAVAKKYSDRFEQLWESGTSMREVAGVKTSRR